MAGRTSSATAGSTALLAAVVVSLGQAGGCSRHATSVGAQTDAGQRFAEVLSTLRSYGKDWGPTFASDCAPQCDNATVCLANEWGGSACFIPCLDDVDCPAGWVCPCLDGCPSQIKRRGDYIIVDAARVADRPGTRPDAR